MAIVSGSSRL
jgi:hypothetical protein